jgi:Ca-activated chloride channel homolog
VATVTMQYRTFNDSTRQKLRHICLDNFTDFKQIANPLQLATAVTMFALKLRQSKYMGGADWSDIEIIATAAVDPDNYLQNQFLQLIDKASKIYKKGKKKKKSED